MKSLRLFKTRADLVKSQNPESYLTEVVELPDSERELFFDIKVDPMQNFCYLHGFVERSNSDNNTEKYQAFYAVDLSLETEEKAFEHAWQYIFKNQPCMFTWQKQNLPS